MSVAFLVGWTAFLIVAYEVLRRSPLAGWVCFLVLPPLLLPRWIQVGQWDWLPWLKIASAVLACCWFTAVRFTRLGGSRRAMFVVFLFIVGNILEAVVKDFSQASGPHWFNAAAGLLVAATLCRRLDTIGVDRRGPFRDLDWAAVTRPWCVGYTIWNWVFVQLNYPQYSLGHTTALTAALILGLFRPDRYVQARAYTFTVSLMLDFSLPGFFADEPAILDGTLLGNPTLIALAALGYMACFTGWSAWSARRAEGTLAAESPS